MLASITGTPIEEPTAGRPGPDPLTLRLERALRRFRLQSAHNLLDEALAAARRTAFLRDVACRCCDQLEADGNDARGALRRVAVRASGCSAHARGWERVRGPLVVLACAPREERTLA